MTMIKTEAELLKDKDWGSDPVQHPSHYTAGPVECIDAIDSAVTGLEGYQAVYTAQVIKYIYRWKRKNGLEDLKKAEWYLQRLIKKIKEEDKK